MSDEQDEQTKSPMLLTPAIDAWATARVDEYFTTHGHNNYTCDYGGPFIRFIHRHDWLLFVVGVTWMVLGWFCIYAQFGYVLAWMFNLNYAKAGLAAIIFREYMRSSRAKIEPHSDWSAYTLKVCVVYGYVLGLITGAGMLTYLVVF
jgi:hypothetical protein